MDIEKSAFFYKITFHIIKYCRSCVYCTSLGQLILPKAVHFRAKVIPLIRNNATWLVPCISYYACSLILKLPKYKDVQQTSTCLVYLLVAKSQSLGTYYMVYPYT